MRPRRNLQILSVEAAGPAAALQGPALSRPISNLGWECQPRPGPFVPAGNQGAEIQEQKVEAGFSPLLHTGGDQGWFQLCFTQLVPFPSCASISLGPPSVKAVTSTLLCMDQAVKGRALLQSPLWTDPPISPHWRGFRRSLRSRAPLQAEGVKVVVGRVEAPEILSWRAGGGGDGEKAATGSNWLPRSLHGDASDRGWVAWWHPHSSLLMTWRTGHPDLQTFSSR